MPRSRPATNPLSFHRPTGQYYITRGRRRLYLGAVRAEALRRYHRLALTRRPYGLAPADAPAPPCDLTVKELANRFLTVQQSNWRAPETTLRSYQGWFTRFLRDHPGIRVAEFTVERFAAWKLSLRRRGYAAESINHYLTAVRSLFAFAQDTDLVAQAPKLRRVRNEPIPPKRPEQEALYTQAEIRDLLGGADVQLRLMILLGLNCGFGPKDIRDLKWSHVEDDHVALRRTKTGISQTFRLWPETLQALEQLRRHRWDLIDRMGDRGRERSDEGFVFVTRFWRQWGKDTLGRQFRRLCRRTGVRCRGFYRLRHCASTALSLVTMPHVQRRFLRHRNLQQQVTYTHAPDEEVNEAIMKARQRLLAGCEITKGPERSPAPGAGASTGEDAPPGPAGSGAPETPRRPSG